MDFLNTITDFELSKLLEMDNIKEIFANELNKRKAEAEMKNKMYPKVGEIYIERDRYDIYDFAMFKVIEILNNGDLYVNFIHVEHDDVLENKFNVYEYDDEVIHVDTSFFDRYEKMSNDEIFNRIKVINKKWDDESLELKSKYSVGIFSVLNEHIEELKMK